MDLVDRLLPRRRGRLPRGPVALPTVLDAVSDRWWALPPRVRAAVVVTAALGLLALAGRGATASPWGPPVPTLVAGRDLPAGHALTPADVATATWPAGLVPDDALGRDDLGGDARLAAPARAGTPLARGDLVDGVAGLVADGHVAVAVPVDGLPAVRAGDHVDVVAGSPDGVGQRVASDAPVVAVDGAFLWLGVPHDRVDAVAAAGAAGRITLAVRPARPP